MVDELKANSQFEILIPDRVLETPPPTPEELRILYEIDPAGIALGKG
jgi:hypothetical protein